SVHRNETENVTMAKFAMHKWWLLTAVLTVPVLAVAAVPNIFAPGTPISSTAVNNNFKDLDGRLAALEAAAASTRIIGFAHTTGGNTVAGFGGVGTSSVTVTPGFPQ